MPLKAKMHKKACFTSRGFTLIEMVVTIAIIAIAAAIATPVIGEWTSNSRFNAAARDIVSSLQRVKMEAAKRNVTCAITYTNVIIDTDTYDYILYVDTTNPPNLIFDGADVLLNAVNFPRLGNVRFDTNQGGGDGSTLTNNLNLRPAVAFNSRGLPVNNVGASGAGSVFITNDRGRTKAVRVSAAGYININ